MTVCGVREWRPWCVAYRDIGAAEHVCWLWHEGLDEVWEARVACVEYERAHPEYEWSVQRVRHPRAANRERECYACSSPRFV